MNHREVSTEKGWDHLIAPLIQFVEQNGGYVAQVKEKFGQLRFHYNEPLELNEQEREMWDEFQEMVRAAELLSTITCEYTGAYGKIREIKGWMKCMSDTEYENIQAEEQHHSTDHK